MIEKLDRTDIQILKILQENGRITVKELAFKVHLSTTPVFERMKRLESEGYIQRYTAVLNPAKLGRGFIVFCSVRLRRMGRRDLLQRLAHRVPPKLGILLRPAVGRLGHGIFAQRGSDRRSRFVEQYGFGAGRADVDTD